MKRSTYPGSVYAVRGKLAIKFKGKTYYTGLDDNKLGRRRAEEMKIKLFEDYNRIGNSNNKPILIEEAFEDFLQFKFNRLPKTIQSYKSAFQKIISGNYYLSENSIESDIRNYLKYTVNSNTTKNIYLRDLQIFLNYCTKKRWLPPCDFQTDYKVKSDSNKKGIFEENEIELLTGYFDLHDKEFSLLLRLMVATGARVVDCLTLTWQQIKPEIIIWHNKKTKEEEPTPFFPDVVTIINELKKLRHYQLTDKVFRWSYVSASSLRRNLISAMKFLEIPINKRCFQNFRVTFHMKIAAMNLPLHIELALMRHSDYRITKKHYTPITQTEILSYVQK